MNKNERIRTALTELDLSYKYLNEAHKHLLSILEYPATELFYPNGKTEVIIPAIGMTPLGHRLDSTLDCLEDALWDVRILKELTGRN